MSAYLYGYPSQEHEGRVVTVMLEHDDDYLPSAHPVTGVALQKLIVWRSAIRRDKNIANLLGCTHLEGMFFVLKDYEYRDNSPVYLDGIPNVSIGSFTEVLYEVGRSLPQAAPGFDITSN